MKREIGAGLLLAAIIVCSVLSIRQTDRLCGEILSSSEKAYEMSMSGRYSDAEDALRDALNLWLESDDFTHIFIRHSEIDYTADALFEAIGALSSEDAEEIRASMEKLRYHLISIDRMEHVSLGSIF